MAKWIECKPFGGVNDTTIVVNLEQLVSLSGDSRATVVRYAGHPDCSFVVEGSPHDILAKQPLFGE